MSINTDIQLKNDYIHFKINGVFSGLDIDTKILDIFHKVVEYAEKYNCFRVLLDATELDYEIGVDEEYKIGEFIANIYRKNLIRIACLRTSDKKDDFTEIVAYNRGASFKFFYDENEAVNWLKY
jgi:hypothetical protein